MPRRKTAVKNKLSHKRRLGAPLKNFYFKTPGVVDIHFHGAFGIDLMVATDAELDRLSEQLWKNGVAAFCPTTLSTPHAPLLKAVERIGSWIMKTRSQPGFRGAIPLGLHLEGPYIHPGACGAHPPGSIRKLDFAELDELWESSLQTLKILTVASETLSPEERKKLHAWAQPRKITLSLGHSKATQEQATEAFSSGFQGVTHAWNAMSFHHRAPGVMGAALGNPEVYLELILDQIHVAPEVIRWTRLLHPAERLCFVSDCVPAAATPPGTWHSFGDLKIEFRDGAGRLPGGLLAGGGKLLPQLFVDWVKAEISRKPGAPEKLVKSALPSLSQAQLKALGFSAGFLKKKTLTWTLSKAGHLCFEVDSWPQPR